MALFKIAGLPQFVDSRVGSVALQFVALGACTVILAPLASDMVALP